MKGDLRVSPETWTQMSPKRYRNVTPHLLHFRSLAWPGRLAPLVPAFTLACAVIARAGNLAVAIVTTTI